MTSVCENFTLELIAWNSFAPSLSLVSFLSLHSKTCKTGCIILHTWLQGRLGLNLQLSHTNTLTIMILLPTSFSVAIHLHPYCHTLSQPYVITYIFSRNIMLLFACKFLFMFAVLSIKEYRLYDIIIYKHQRNSC